MALGVRDLPIVSRGARSPEPDHEDYEEISLVDIVRVLYRRRLIFVLVLTVALVGGVALVFLTTPQYEAEATLIPLEREGIIVNWLDSRQAADYVATQTGDSLKPLLFPGRWDETANAWIGEPPAAGDASSALMGHVRVSGGARPSAPITVSVTLSDPTVARDVAAAYIASLAVLRPELENITRSELFDKYYTESGNAQEAQRRAETVAGEKSYWLTFDSPVIPQSAVKPRPVLYMALATALGVVGSIMTVFALEWLSKYRGDFTRLEPPP